MRIKTSQYDYHIDAPTYYNLKLMVKDVVKYNDDAVIVLDGKEGAGKSVLARQIATTIYHILQTEYKGITQKWFTPKPNSDYLFFDLKTYLEKSIKGAKFQSNILDESRKILNRKVGMSKSSRMFTDYMSECRKFNQFHILCLPAYHDLDKYIVLWRMKMLITVEKYHKLDAKTGEYELHRGTYKCRPINKELIKYWEEGRYNYPSWNPTKKGGHTGRFENVEVFDNMEKYVERQKLAMNEKFLHDEETENKIVKIKEEQEKSLTELKNVLAYIRQFTDLKLTDVSRKTGIPYLRVKNYSKEEIKSI